MFKFYEGQVAQTTGIEQIILAWLAEERGIDFRDYRRASLTQGITYRSEQTGCKNPFEYFEFLKQHKFEWDNLIETLILPVTQFYRDEEVFRSLEQIVLPKLKQRKNLRVWSIGCATGEEPWTLAMLLYNVLGTKFELLATDINRRSLQIAKQGEYSNEVLSSLPEHLFTQHIVKDTRTGRIAAHLKPMVHFCEHDLMGMQLTPGHAVVASFDLILLRNVLIYFDRRLQQKAIERLVPVLDPEGVLTLGLVETLPQAIQHRFKPFVDTESAWRIFQLRRML